MIERRYKWRFSHGVPADVVGDVISGIESRDGVVTKRSFLEESRPEDAPTHNCFEWNDSEAAEKWRLWQAGQIIRDLVVTVVSDDEEQVSTPMFVNVEESRRNEAVFISTETAMLDDEQRKKVLANALKELKIFKDKYSKLKELQGIFQAIEEIEK